MRSPTAGHRYLTCVVDHATGRLVWAGEGHSARPWAGSSMNSSRAGGRLTTCPATGGVDPHLVAQRAPQAGCLDPFHVVAWALKALDKVRGAHHDPRRDPIGKPMWAMRNEQGPT